VEAMEGEEEALEEEGGAVEDLEGMEEALEEDLEGMEEALEEDLPAVPGLVAMDHLRVDQVATVAGLPDPVAHPATEDAKFFTKIFCQITLFDPSILPDWT